jgi:hypothetical protein
MSRFIDEPDSNPKIRDLKVRIPTIDELMRRPQPPPWWQFLPPPAPSKNSDPFGPVPIVPPLPPPPIKVDPPSRPPEWMFGPPYLSRFPTQVPSFGPAYASVIAASPQEKSGGLLRIMTQAGLIDPSNPDGVPSGGLLGLIQEHLRNNGDREVGG